MGAEEEETLASIELVLNDRTPGGMKKQEARDKNTRGKKQEGRQAVTNDCTVDHRAMYDIRLQVD